jgi:hypothetical protein
MKVIAISGIARSGKDTIADKLSEVISEMNPGLKISRESFASILKQEMSTFIYEKFNKDIFSLEGQDKENLRPLLVAYGSAKRNLSNGRYFIEALQKKISIENNDLCIISDLRYADRDFDELHWLKNEMGGKLIHIKRYSVIDNQKKQKKFLLPPNEDEKRNDPVLNKNSDFNIIWPSAKNDIELNEMARNFCEDFYYKNISYLI